MYINKFILASMLLFCAQSSLSLAAANTNAKSLWKEWYLFTLNGQAQGYYSEEAERRPKEGQLAISQRWLERDEGVMESYIGSVAKDDESFTPVAFYVERKSPQEATSIDARKKNDTFVVQIKNGSSSKKLAISAEKGVLWSNFLSLAIAKLHKTEGNASFSTIVEDAKDGNYNPQVASVIIKKDTKKIRNESCQKYLINFQDVDSEWWITKEGKLCEVAIPSIAGKITLSTEKEASQAFLGAAK